MIRPISSTTPACYGVCCPHRATCLRYQAVEATSPDHTISTCSDGKGGWPLVVVAVAEAKPAQQEPA